MLFPALISSLIGEIVYFRAQYEYYDENGKKIYVFLLDEAMGISGIGHFSDLLTDRMRIIKNIEIWRG